MNQTNLLQKIAPVGVAAFGVLSFTGITPAQAAVIGSLGFDNGSTSFIQAFDLTAPGTANDFSITFSPAGITQISESTGVFLPPGPIPPAAPVQVAVNSPIGNFSLINTFAPIDPAVNAFSEFEFRLDNNIFFDFGGGETVTYLAGSTFLAEVDVALGNPTLAEGVEVEALALGAIATTTDGNTYTLTGIDCNTDSNFTCQITGEDFGFAQDVGGIASRYLGGVVVSSTRKGVPEPTTILGLLTVGSLGLGLKRKKQS